MLESSSYRKFIYKGDVQGPAKVNEFSGNDNGLNPTPFIYQACTLIAGPHIYKPCNLSVQLMPGSILTFP